MTEVGVHRKLAAILVADVVGYSRLIEADEAGTLARLRALWQAVVEPSIARHGGRVCKTTGDGALVEFSSAVDAVRCAVSIQMGSLHPLEPADNVLRYRIGIHLGDVVIEGDDILGDGINIAARLEGLAPPGGIAISGSLQEQVAGKVSTAFSATGEQTLKNISRPVSVWVWRPGDVEPGNAATTSHRKAAGRNPLVAVMQFLNRGSETVLSNFAESLADDLTTALSRRRGIDVVARGAIARQNVAASDGPSIRAATRADYMLCGAVQRVGERIRVTAELIDAASGGQLWTERYDRDWSDPFALLDDLTEHIAFAARTAMNAYDGRRFDEGARNALSNAERRAKAAEHFYRFTRADYIAAERLLDDVLRNDPDDAMALAMQAFCLIYQGLLEIRGFDPANRERILELAGRAVECDRASDFAYRTRGMAHLYLSGDCRAALGDAKRALALNPQYGLALHLKAEALIYGERQAEGIAIMRRLIDMDARDPINYNRCLTIALGYFATGEYEDALEAIEYAISGAMGLPLEELTKAAVLVQLGRQDEASETIGTLRSRWPGCTRSNIMLPPFEKAEHRARFRDALGVAGLPD